MYANKVIKVGWERSNDLTFSFPLQFRPTLISLRKLAGRHCLCLGWASTVHTLMVVFISIHSHNVYGPINVKQNLTDIDRIVLLLQLLFLWVVLKTDQHQFLNSNEVA